MDTVGPQVDIVHIGQIPGRERALFGLPGLGQLRDHRRRQPGGRAEELTQRRHKVPAGQPVQVEQRQHLGDLRGLAAPGRQHRGGEPAAPPGVGVDPAVVDPRRDHLDRAGAGQDLPRLMRAVAHHQPTPTLVAVGGKPGDVGVNLRLQSLGQHPPRALAHDLINQRRRTGRPAALIVPGRSRTTVARVVPSRPALARRSCSRACR